MTYEENKAATLRNAAPSMLKLLIYLARSHGHHFYPNEQGVVENMINMASLNHGLDEVDEDYFERLIEKIIPNTESGLFNRPKSEVFVEYVNDFLTIRGMADYYGVDETRLTLFLTQGQEEYKAQLRNEINSNKTL